jgi:hypothetical protein
MTHLLVFAGTTSDLAIEKVNPLGEELQRGDENAKHCPGAPRGQFHAVNQPRRRCKH